MKDVKAIEFVFENFESVTIDSKHIGDFLIEGIETKIRRVAINSISEYTTCERFEMSIYKDANITVESYGDKYKVFNRIMLCDDITGIYLKYEDGTEQEIGVPWEGESDDYNEAQSSFMCDEHLYLAINRECKDVHEIYTDEIVEDLNEDYGIFKIFMK